MAITLYQYTGGDGIGSISPPCLRVDMALRWLGLDFKRLNLRRPGEVSAVSAIGRLPVLEIDGERFCESTSILDELERRFDAPWVVESAQDAAHLRLWEFAINEHYYWCGFYLRWVDPAGRELFLNALLSRASWFLKQMVRRTAIPRRLLRAKLHGCGGRTRESILGELDRAMDLLVTELRGGPFLLGRETPSRADLTVTSMFVQAGFFSTMPDVLKMIEARESIRPYLQRVCTTVGGEKPRWLGP